MNRPDPNCRHDHVVLDLKPNEKVEREQEVAACCRECGWRFVATIKSRSEGTHVVRNHDSRVATRRST